LVELIGAKYRAYDIIFKKLEEGGYKGPVILDNVDDKKELEIKEIDEQTAIDEKALEEDRKLEKLRGDKTAEISVF